MVGRSSKRLFVEGGGDNDALRFECRRGFSMFLEKSGFKGRMPKIVACGGRSNTYKKFCTALNSASTDDVTILLVDSECPITVNSSAWKHVKNRSGDGWDRPAAAKEADLHFMVECMENWFLADKEALSRFFGDGFKENALPSNPNVEEISKSDVYKKLEGATKQSKKKAYDKGAHSFKILAEVDPCRVRRAAPFADRFLTHLDEVL